MSGYKTSTPLGAAFQEYPKWMHRKDGVGSVVVNDKNEMEALGSDWQDFAPGKPELTRSAPTPKDVIENFQEFPKWKHAFNRAPVIVSTQVEEDALPGLWFDFKKDADAYGDPDAKRTPKAKEVEGEKEMGGAEERLEDADPIVAKQLADDAEKNDLVDQAVALGVRVNKTWGLPRLRKEVQAAKDNG